MHMGIWFIWGTTQFKDPHRRRYVIWIRAGTLQVQQKKLNTKSSTDAEVVGVSDYLPQSIWICLSMEAQVYDIKQNIIFQENQITTSMENNGKESCTRNSRQINVRYLFVKERVDSNNKSIP